MILRGSVQTCAGPEEILGAVHMELVNWAQKSILPLGWSRQFWLPWREALSRWASRALREWLMWDLVKRGIAPSTQPPLTALLFLVSLFPGIFLVEKRQEKSYSSSQIFLLFVNYSFLSPAGASTSMKRFFFSLLSPIKFPPWGNGYKMTSLIEGAKGQRKYILEGRFCWHFSNLLSHHINT